MLTRAEEARASCPNPETLEKVLRDELSPAEADLVEKHVGTCPGCQRVLQRLLGSLPGPLHPLTKPQQGAADEEPPGLPGYAPMGRISAGGMGVVWRVQDLDFQRPLAVKVIQWAVGDNLNAVRRFLAEARITGQLAHPPNVPVHA